MTNETKNTVQIGFLALGGLFIYKKFLANKEQQYQQNAQNAVNNVPAPVQAQMTFSMARALVLANILEVAMRRSEILTADIDGTDEQAIYNVFNEIKNKEDMKAVYKQFGVRVYTHGFFTGTIKLDLIGMLRKELSNAEYNKIKPKLDWIG